MVPSTTSGEQRRSGTRTERGETAAKIGTQLKKAESDDNSSSAFRR
jgi:hypothetical protein